MGLEAHCIATVDGQTSEGKALLETNELIFRGAFRLKIPLSEIANLETRDGGLRVVYSGGTAIFELGDKAETWAEKIRNPKGLLDKLGVKSGQRVVALRVPGDGFVDELRGRGAQVFARAVGDADLIFVGAERLDALDDLGRLSGYLKRDGAIWTVTPKGKGGIKDTDVIAAGRRAGLVDVKVASFSATHSAAKFVIPKAKR